MNFVHNRAVWCSLPPCGGGLGWEVAANSEHVAPRHPDPPPQRGEGTYPDQPYQTFASTRPARLTLVLGGARSGKSRHAETLMAALPPPWIYVATAEALDDEMAARIAEHRGRRDHRWRTIEAPRDVAGALRSGPAGAPVLVDCLTLWLSNLMLAQSDIEDDMARLDAALDAVSGSVIVVANEVGLGIVPDNALGRRFRDAAGRLNQRLAARADRVVLMVAGLPLNVK